MSSLKLLWPHLTMVSVSCCYDHSVQLIFVLFFKSEYALRHTHAAHKYTPIHATEMYTCGGQKKSLLDLLLPTCEIQRSNLMYHVKHLMRWIASLCCFCVFSLCSMEWLQAHSHFKPTSVLPLSSESYDCNTMLDTDQTFLNMCSLDCKCLRCSWL